jgi:membrane fusion protein (multidrug efflux system)
LPLALGLLLVPALSACGSTEAEPKRPPPLVKVESPVPASFANRIEAVGTAHANEQVVLSAPVTERIVRLNFSDGGFVRRGQVVAVLAAQQEGAQLAEATAATREAEQQLARLRVLRERGFATKSGFDAQTAAAAQARARADIVRSSIEERVVRAPFSGWSSLRNISVGAIVQAGTEIMTISDVSVIKLDFSVPEAMHSVIRPGLDIKAESAAYPGVPFAGRIATIDTVVDPATRAVKVRAHLPNPSRQIKPGMLLSVTIEGPSRLSLSVPELAIVTEGERSFVMLVGKDQVAKRAAVRTGARSGGRIEILAGLAPDDRFVTEGLVRINEGSKVRIAAGVAPAAVAKAAGR